MDDSSIILWLPLIIRRPWSLAWPCWCLDSQLLPAAIFDLLIFMSSSVAGPSRARLGWDGSKWLMTQQKTFQTTTSNLHEQFNYNHTIRFSQCVCVGLSRTSKLFVNLGGSDPVFELFKTPIRTSMPITPNGKSTDHSLFCFLALRRVWLQWQIGSISTLVCLSDRFGGKQATAAAI